MSPTTRWRVVNLLGQAVIFGWYLRHSETSMLWATFVATGWLVFVILMSLVERIVKRYGDANE